MVIDPFFELNPRQNYGGEERNHGGDRVNVVLFTAKLNSSATLPISGTRYRRNRWRELASTGFSEKLSSSKKMGLESIPFII